ncbi:MAG: hypothetical protein IPK82_05000 [Polyangiaceae bacterium]|nr:hypothetical protein [Polyangiaceae bacterium]
MQKTLHKKGFSQIRVVAVAGAPGKAASLRIERIPVDALSNIGRVLATFVEEQ